MEYSKIGSLKDVISQLEYTNYPQKLEQISIPAKVPGWIQRAEQRTGSVFINIFMKIPRSSGINISRQQSDQVHSLIRKREIGKMWMSANGRELITAKETRVIFGGLTIIMLTNCREIYPKKK